MGEIRNYGWLIHESDWKGEEELQTGKGNEPGEIASKTVMVYWFDKKNMRKEPIGILTERRKAERDNNNAIGMLRRARKEFAKTEEEIPNIVIGDYV